MTFGRLPVLRAMVFGPSAFGLSKGTTGCARPPRVCRGAVLRLVLALFAALGPALVLPAAPALAAKPAVLDLTIGAHDGATRVVLEFSERLAPEIFSLTDDYRLVIDLPEVDWRVAGGAVLPGSRDIRRVRYARNRPGHSRIVLDLAGPLSIANKALLADNARVRLVLDLSRTDRAAFMRTAGWPARHLLVPGGNDRGHAKARPAPAPKIRVGAAGTAPDTPRRAPADATRRVIVLDAGHGGHDPGAIGRSGVYEKTVALAMARQLRDVLEKSGRYTVRMTRSRDVFVPLPERVTFARESKADLFMSIHADANTSPSVRGTSVYTLSEQASDTAAARLAQKENAINGLESEAVAGDVLKILIELAQRDTMNNSVRFAQTLLPALRGRDIGLLRNTHRFGPFWVLTAADVPSVLLEMGFMSNVKDEKLITSPAWRAKLAAGILDSLDRYFGFEEVASLPKTAALQ